MNVPETHWYDCFRCLCCKKKEEPIRRHSEAKVETVVETALHLEAVRHGRFSSQENLSIHQALSWDGHYTFKIATKENNPDQITIKEMQ